MGPVHSGTSAQFVEFPALGRSETNDRKKFVAIRQLALANLRCPHFTLQITPLQNKLLVFFLVLRWGRRSGEVASDSGTRPDAGARARLLAS